MNLSQEQTTAATHSSGVTVCTAGPGSGKTTVLVERITNAIKSPLVGYNCVVLTFTNAAANEMRERLDAIIPGASGMLPHIGTLHSYLLKLLAKHGEAIGFLQPVTVIDEDMAEEILKATAEQFRYSGTKKDLSEALATNPILTKPSGIASKAQLVAIGYYRNMLQNGFATYDDILTYGLALLRALVQGSPFTIGALFVDEAQDSGATDWAIYNVLRSVAGSVFVVGDYNQSIYGFRGATPQGMHAMIGQTCSLRDNYRSTPEVCAAAERLIRANPMQEHVRICPISKQSGSVRVVRTPTETTEAMRVAEALAGYPASNSKAVLCRTNWQVQGLATLLRGFGIKVRERKLANLPLDWSVTKSRLALLANPHNDTLALRHLASTLGRKEAERIAIRAAENYQTINEETLHLERIKGPVKNQHLLGKLVELGCSQESMALVCEIMIGLAGGPDKVGSQTIEEVMLAVNSYEMTQQDDGEGVDVCTIHAAKGREWDHVVLPGWNEGVLPSKNGDTAEERRLAFVAITRARYTVDVLYTEERRLNSWMKSPAPVEPSRFIAEAFGKEQPLAKQSLKPTNQPNQPNTTP